MHGEKRPGNEFIILLGNYFHSTDMHAKPFIVIIAALNCLCFFLEGCALLLTCWDDSKGQRSEVPRYCELY